MNIPIIHTSATNIELSQQRKALIERKMFSLARLLPHGQPAEVDVVVRKITGPKGDMFSVSAKLSTESGTYMAVTTGHYLTRALSEASGYLRQSLCYGESVATPFDYSVEPATA